MGAALIAATLTGLATGLGALPFLFIRELPRRVYDGVLGLGAGLMLSAATLGLLAEALTGVRTNTGTTGGSLDGGRLAFAAAQCVFCHRMGNTGASVGPDLSAVASRLNRRDLLDSILTCRELILTRTSKPCQL